jgi:hypothetical protein
MVDFLVPGAAAHESEPARKLARMIDLVALSDAWKASIALIAVFGVVFPALATGLIVFAAAQAAAERQQNLERRARRQR